MNHITHRKEAESKRCFEKVIDPFVVNWHGRDYGVDGTVQLSSNTQKDGSADMDSLFFLVQLKATASLKYTKSVFSFGVDVTKLIEWAKANLPVLLVVYDLNTKSFYSKWINEELINFLNRDNPSWSTKVKIQLKFSVNEDALTSESLSTFKDFLTRFKAKRALIPGQYFEFRDRLKQIIETFRAITDPFSLSSTKHSLALLNEKLETAIYRIAIAGPSRAGKSTLINALLRKNVSPVGMFQTTGVPIQVIPGKEDKVVVYFKDNNKIEEHFNASVIQKYSSQTPNLDDVKKVKFVCLTLVNPELEKGISFFDVPGLDDPDEEILIPALSYVSSCNAIIYLIDAAPMTTGGFAFKADYKRQLLEMTSSMDKVFLVLNKTDQLDQSQLDDLKKRIDYDLTRFGLKEKLNSQINYISAGKSLIVRTKSSNYEGDSVQSLEKDIWKFLLEGNKSGVYRLIDVIQELKQCRNEFAELLNTRLLNSLEQDQLVQAIEMMQNRLPELEKIFHFKCKYTKQQISALIATSKAAIYEKLEKELRAIPLNKNLPSDVEVKKYLMSEIQQVVEKGNYCCSSETNQYRCETDQWIEINLKKIKEIINTNTKPKEVDISAIESLVLPPVDLSDSWGMGIIGGIVGALMNPGGAIVGALLGFFGHILLSADGRRSRQIVKTVESSKRKCDAVFADLENNFHLAADEFLFSVFRCATEKISLYFRDMNSQIAKYDSKHLTKQERAQHQSRLNDLKKFDHEISRLHGELARFS